MKTTRTTTRTTTLSARALGVGLACVLGCASPEDRGDPVESVGSTSAKADGSDGVVIWQLYEDGGATTIVGVGRGGTVLSEWVLRTEASGAGRTGRLELRNVFPGNGRIVLTEGGDVLENTLAEDAEAVEAFAELDQDFAPLVPSEEKADLLETVCGHKIATAIAVAVVAGFISPDRGVGVGFLTWLGLVIACP